jgi:hypothetical protein
MLSNFNISIYTNVGSVIVVVLFFFGRDCLICTLIFLSILIIYIYFNLHSTFFDGCLSLSIFYLIRFLIFRCFLINWVFFFSLVWFRLFFFCLVNLSLSMIFKKIEFILCKVIWNLTFSTNIDWNFSYFLFLSFVNSFELCFQLCFPLLSLLFCFFFILNFL